jgi:hypothetical protein
VLAGVSTAVVVVVSLSNCTVTGVLAGNPPFKLAGVAVASSAVVGEEAGRGVHNGRGDSIEYGDDVAAVVVEAGVFTYLPPWTHPSSSFGRGVLLLLFRRKEKGVAMVVVSIVELSLVGRTDGSDEESCAVGNHQRAADD